MSAVISVRPSSTTLAELKAIRSLIDSLIADFGPRCQHCKKAIESRTSIINGRAYWVHAQNGHHQWCDLNSPDELTATPEVTA